jgi:predicted ATPase
VIITSINIPENFLDRGLKNININRLGDTVVIAGKNGAGKTRLLNLIFECVNKDILKENEFATISEEIKNYTNSINNNASSPHAKAWNETLTHLTKRKKIDSHFILDSRQEKHTALKFVPNNLSFVNPNGFSKIQMDNAYTSAMKREEIEKMNQYVLGYIQRICENEFSASHPRNAENPDNAAYIESFERLNNLVSSFLGTKIIREVEDCTIFGRDIGNAGLSDGQKVLLQLCVLIHAQGAILDNLILILDEPENHLHPEAQIEFIKKTKEVLKNGQIWIATHSIHILSFLNMTDI